MGDRLTDVFLQLFCEKNSDGSRKLRLKGNELQQRIGKRLISADMKRVVDFILDHPDVNDVNLCYNDIGDDGLEILCGDLLSKPNNIVHLNLMHCELTVAGMKQLYFTSFEGNLIIETLRLCGNKLGPNGGHMVALLLPYMPSLHYLDLGDTDQTTDSIDNLFHNLWWSNITVLNISRLVSHSCLNPSDPSELAGSISELLRVNKTIKELHAQKCSFDGHDVELILEGLSKNSTLLFLDLGYNNIGDFGVGLLADWLKTRPNLLGLNVAGNGMRNLSARALSLTMPFSKVRFLDISHNKIHDDGLVFILNSIKKKYMLRYLYFWGNLFGHKVNQIVERLLRSQILRQDCIDVKVYCVDNVLYAARYPTDNYKHKYYEVMDHGCPVELKIKRNKIEEEGAEPRALVKFQHIARFPPLQ